MKNWHVIKYVIMWHEMASKWAYLSNFAMRSRAMILKPTPSAQPSAPREVLCPWRFKFLNTCRHRRRMMEFHAGVWRHDFDVLLVIHLRYVLIRERYAQRNMVFQSKCYEFFIGLMPVDRYVGYNHHPSFSEECDVTYMIYLYLRSTNLPGGNQAD